MKDDEDIENMFSMFQTLVSIIQVLNMCYGAPDHVNKILGSLPIIFRPKVTAI